MTHSVNKQEPPGLKVKPMRKCLELIGKQWATALVEKRNPVALKSIKYNPTSHTVLMMSEEVPSQSSRS